MVTRRQRKVAERIHEELGELLQRKVEDPRLAGVTITDVEVTPDLQQATVYYSILRDDEPAAVAAVQAGLESARGFFRRALAEALRLRLVPDLVFCLDHSLARGQRIEQILGTLREHP